MPRTYLITKLSISFLLPCTLYSLSTQLFLLATHNTDPVIRPNSILLLTTSILSLILLASWSLARSNGPIRPPKSGKRICFFFTLTSCILWLACVWTGAVVATRQIGCGIGRGVPWREGMPCRLHRVGVAFSGVGFLASLVVLAAMIEISDRPFGGVSVETNISWTAEKFREALIEIAAREGGAKELLADRTRGEDEEGEMVEERI